MAKKIKFSGSGFNLEGWLNETKTALALSARLPVTVSLSRWGDEYYGDMGAKLGMAEEEGAREEMEIGEIAYWPPGNALCIFFGPTPASTGDEPRAASAVNPVGRLEGDVTVLKSLGDRIEATLEKIVDA